MNKESHHLSHQLYACLIYFQEGSVAVYHAMRENYSALLGTAGSWFILDVVFYANGLFSGQVTKAMGIAKDPRGEAIASMILNVSLIV